MMSPNQQTLFTLKSQHEIGINITRIPITNLFNLTRNIYYINVYNKSYNFLFKLLYISILYQPYKTENVLIIPFLCNKIFLNFLIWSYQKYLIQFLCLSKNIGYYYIAS